MSAVDKYKNMLFFFSEVCPLGGFSQDSLKYVFVSFFVVQLFFDIVILSIDRAFLLDAIVAQPFLAVLFS